MLKLKNDKMVILFAALLCQISKKNNLMLEITFYIENNELHEYFPLLNIKK